MKTLTIEIPDDANEAEARLAAQRAADPDWIAIWWHVDDVLSLDSELTNDECCKVLGLADESHDANIGINWDTLGCYIEQVKAMRTGVES